MRNKREGVYLPAGELVSKSKPFSPKENAILSDCQDCLVERGINENINETLSTCMVHKFFKFQKVNKMFKFFGQFILPRGSTLLCLLEHNTSNGIVWNRRLSGRTT